MRKEVQVLFAVLGVAIFAALVIVIFNLQELKQGQNVTAPQNYSEQAADGSGTQTEELGEQDVVVADKIGEIDDENCKKAIESVLHRADPAVNEEPVSAEMTEVAENCGAKINTIYRVDNDYAIKVSCSGSQGTLVIMIGIDEAGCITGVSVVSHSETSGIGTKVVDNETLTNGVGALDQYQGKSMDDYPLELGADVDTISGATVTSEAIKNGANAALAVYELLK